MNPRLEAVRCCLPYATSTAHTEQLEDIVDAEIDVVCARAAAAVEFARKTLALYASGELLGVPLVSSPKAYLELPASVE